MSVVSCFPHFMISSYTLILNSSKNTITCIHGFLPWFWSAQSSIKDSWFPASCPDPKLLASYLLCRHDCLPSTQLHYFQELSLQNFLYYSVITCPKPLSNLGLTLWLLKSTPGLGFIVSLRRALEVTSLIMATSQNISLHLQFHSNSTTSLKVQFKSHCFRKDYPDFRNKKQLLKLLSGGSSILKSCMCHFYSDMLHCTEEEAWPTENPCGFRTLGDRDWILH